MLRCSRVLNSPLGLLRQGSDTLCRWAMEVFYSSYGAEAGSVALKFLPFGGLYIAGGIAPKNLGPLMASTPNLPRRVPSVCPAICERSAPAPHWRLKRCCL